MRLLGLSIRKRLPCAIPLQPVPPHLRSCSPGATIAGMLQPKHQAFGWGIAVALITEMPTGSVFYAVAMAASADRTDALVRSTNSVMESVFGSSFSTASHRLERRAERIPILLELA